MPLRVSLQAGVGSEFQAADVALERLETLVDGCQMRRQNTFLAKSFVTHVALKVPLVGDALKRNSLHLTNKMVDEQDGIGFQSQLQPILFLGRTCPAQLT